MRHCACPYSGLLKQETKSHFLSLKCQLVVWQLFCGQSSLSEVTITLKRETLKWLMKDAHKQKVYTENQKEPQILQTVCMHFVRNINNLPKELRWIQIWDFTWTQNPSWITWARVWNSLLVFVIKKAEHVSLSLLCPCFWDRPACLLYIMCISDNIQVSPRNQDVTLIPTSLPDI